MVDAANSIDFSSSRGADYFYPERGSSAIYLCPILDDKNSKDNQENC